MIVAAAVVLPACGSDSESGASGGELHFDASRQFRGSYSISGVITVPSPAQGKAVMLNIVGPGLSGNTLGLAGTLPAGTTATYTITGLSAQAYKIQAGVDVTGDNQVNSPGDYVGWTGGTVSAPKLEESAADAISVTGSMSSVDFGLAVVP
jgi:hypothetical protein